MKTDAEIRGALAHHSANKILLRADPKQLEDIAKQLGWTVEYSKGYQDGVEWAYQWVLGSK